MAKSRHNPILRPLAGLLLGLLTLLLPAGSVLAAGRARFFGLFGGRGGGGGGSGGGGGGGGERWSGPVGATVELSVTMPEWTRGWLRAGVAWGPARQPAPTATVFGRDIEATSHHVLLMRTKSGESGVHSWGPAPLAHDSRPWERDVYQEKWPAVADLSGGWQADTPAGRSPPTNQEYRRFHRYVGWSE
ncbi:MAG: hypothetical protein WC789_01940 [Lentisphaeria bacterium]|jgi:hypothetical protein